MFEFSLKSEKVSPIFHLLKASLYVSLLLIIILFVYNFISQENYIYFWDYSTYFGFFDELGAKFLQKPFKAIDSIFISIRKADYNTSSIVPLLPFYYFFGSNRISYICSIAVVYAFPIIALFPTFITKTFNFASRNGFDKLLLYAALIFVIGFLPQLWIPILLGYVDVVGVGVIFLILYLYLKKNLLEQNLKNLFVLGFLLCLLVILRRWYAYWVVGFFTAAVFQILFNISGQSEKLSLFWKSVKKLLIIGLTAVISFFALATQIALKMITTDYRDIYSAYRKDEGIYYDLVEFFNHFGLSITLLFLAGIIFSVYDKKSRPYGFFLSIIFATTFLIFTRTQNIDVHHYYWVISLLVIFVGILVSGVFSRFKTLKSKVVFLLSLFVFGFLNFSVVFFPAADSLLKPIAFALPQERIYPKNRNDIEQIHLLLLELDKLTKDSDSNIYVLSSSLSLNGSLVKNATSLFEPELKNLDKKLLLSHDVDKRDGFPFQLFEADYVVVTDPFGYHLSPKDQKIVIIPAHQIINGKTIGQAFEKTSFETTLFDGRRVFIYKKIRNFQQEELRTISEMFIRFYPNNREKFQISPDMLEKLSKD